MSQKEKVVHLHVHQAVRFGGTLATFFTSKPGPGKTQASFEIRPELFCVEVFNKEDRVLIPFVNISAIHLDCIREKARDEKKAKEESKPKTTLKSSDIKRPK